MTKNYFCLKRSPRNMYLKAQWQQRSAIELHRKRLSRQGLDCHSFTGYFTLMPLLRRHLWEVVHIFFIKSFLVGIFPSQFDILKVFITQSRLTLCNPMDCSPPCSSVYGIFQARILEWTATSFYRGCSLPKDQSWVSNSEGRFSTI